MSSSNNASSSSSTNSNTSNPSHNANQHHTPTSSSYTPSTNSNSFINPSRPTTISLRSTTSSSLSSDTFNPSHNAVNQHHTSASSSSHPVAIVSHSTTTSSSSLTQPLVSNNIDQPHPNTLSVHRRRRLTRPSLPLQRQRNWRNENQIRSKEFNKKYRIYHYKCCFPKCNNHDGIPNITCHEIPAPNDQNVKPMPDEVTTRIRTVENWHCKEMRHEIVLNRLNIDKENYNKKMRLCNLHEWEMVPIKKTSTRKNGKKTF